MKKLIFIFFVVISIICSSCGKILQKPETSVRTVKIDTVHLLGGSQKSVYSGMVRPSSEVSLSFRVAGTIAEIPFAEGTFVCKGTVIAKIDDRDYRIQLSATEAEYYEIKALSEKVIELYKRGSATKNDYDKAVSGLEQITAKYNAHKNQLADTRLIAPFDGYIQKKIHQAGETVGAGMSVVSMIGNGEWQIEINLPVQDYVRRDDFINFEASVSTEPDKKFALDLYELVPKGNANQLYKMVFKVKKNNDIALAAGMSVEVTITYKTEQQVVYQIPVSAVFEKDGYPHVWIFTSEEEYLQAKWININEIKQNGYVIVSEGVQEGDMIVTAGVNTLKDSTKVKPLSPTSKTNIGGLL
jgi:RND family efflux transporter MFP subunit